MHEVNDAARAVREAEAIFVGGGNSFRLLRTLNRLGVLDALRRAVVREVPIGTDLSFLLQTTPRFDIALAR